MSSSGAAVPSSSAPTPASVSRSTTRAGPAQPLPLLVRLALAALVVYSVWNVYFFANFHRLQAKGSAHWTTPAVAESLQRFVGPMAGAAVDGVSAVLERYAGQGLPPLRSIAGSRSNSRDGDTRRRIFRDEGQSPIWGDKHANVDTTGDIKNKRASDIIATRGDRAKNESTARREDKRHEAKGKEKVTVLSEIETDAEADADNGDDKPKDTKSRFAIDLAAAESYLAAKGPSQLRQTLTAYVEPALNDRDTAVPYDQGDAKDKTNIGKPPKFVVPLPLRTHKPDDLLKFEYPKVQTCADLPAKLPVDAGLLLNDRGEHKIINVNNRQTIQDPLADAAYCPVNADPFLPWLHDVFPSPNGRAVHFIAQNKRRCNTGNRFLPDLERLEPQVALMQPISVERIEEGRAQELAPELWTPEGEKELESEEESSTSRYRLASFEEASSDGQYTRFICRFHAMSIGADDGQPRSTVIGETLSTYPINYELANYRKAMPSFGSMLSPKGKDNAQFWLSNFRFGCPVPDVAGLAETIAAGGGIMSDGTPLIHVDVVPIRTSPRFGVQEVHFTEELAGKRGQYGQDVGDKWRWDEVMGTTPGKYGFDAKTRWGDKNVVPRIEASGRYANIPICRPPPPTLEGTGDDVDAQKGKANAEVKLNAGGTLDAPTDPNRKKKHQLVGCLWASKQYTTRGHENAINDTSERLIEWLEYNLMVGFDHIYVYDNTGAHTDDTDLRETLSRFSPSEVTRIEWPYRVCNNNVPAHENTGERSSQHAAEASCRQRYGAHSEWVAAIDPDEYLVPMGKYDNLKDVLRDAGSKGTEILGFKSTRAFARAELMEPYFDYGDCGTEESPKCLQKSAVTLNLELYNCDVEKLPKPDWAQRAKKQIYRPSYVLSHYVHYSTITKGLVEPCADMEGRGQKCKHRWKERSPTERFSDERNEVVMIHSKTLVPRDSVDWRTRCKPDFVESHKVKCRVGWPVPNYDANAHGEANEDGMKYNCYSYQKVSEVWVPRLREAMKKREENYQAAKLRL